MNPRTDPEQRVEIVVLTYERPKELLRTLDYLRRLPEAPHIRVVDNGSVDCARDTVAVLYPEVEYVRLERNIGAAARNVGVMMAKTPYVALCDDDTWWEGDSITRAAETLDRWPDVAVVTASVLVGEAASLDPASIEMARSPLRRPGLGPVLLGFLAGASVVRRDAFLSAGGFEPRFFLGGEEELLALDFAEAGLHLVYQPGSTVRHYPSSIRDRRKRGRTLERNALWVTWLRRPWRICMQYTLSLCLRALSDGQARAALVAAVTGGSWVPARRKVLSPGVEAQLRLLETQKKADEEKTIRSESRTSRLRQWWALSKSHRGAAD